MFSTCTKLTVLLTVPAMLLALVLPSATGAEAAVAARRSAVQETAPLARPPAPGETTKARIVPSGKPPVIRACPPARRGFAACMSLVRTNVPSHKGLFTHDTTPAGYGPSDFQSAYNLPSATAGAGATVAIVDAYDNPNAASDLATYRAQYGLPACTTASGCFEKVNQSGQQGSYPSANSGWAVEESLDVDMVSAACPSCHIILVEANSAKLADLGAAEDEAVALGAKYVSNSWAEPEQDLGSAATETAYDKYFNHPGVVITAAGGDSGYDNYQVGADSPNYPASSQYVTSVGGTKLTRDSSVPRGWTETTWSPDPAATGSGCSLYEPKPAWQHDPGCANRMTNDVAADADPRTGAAIYDTTGEGGWLEVGGTSEATPLIAATYALAGTPAAGSYPSSYPYADPSALNDVTSGTNYDQSCTPAYFCTAGPGYDGPTGLGTPDGVAAFSPASYGTLAGTVTSASTGRPIAGATVSVDGFSMTTNSSGQYTTAVPAGSYTVTAADYGYATQTDTGVQVSQGQTTTQNFALVTAPMVTLSGTVRDGSGHGWPLHATVSVPGTPAPVDTNPVTGRYSLSVPAQASDAVTVTAVGQGYQQAQQQVSIGTGNQTQDFRLHVDRTACDATGYGLTYTGTTQDFNNSTAPPGWSVVNGANSKHGWEFDDPGGAQNQTGGSGNFAIAYPALYGTGENTEMTSPVIDMTADKSPVVQFDTVLSVGLLYQNVTAKVEVSVDGGQTWSRVWAAPPSGYSDPVVGPARETVALRQAAGKSQVQVRFVYNTHGYDGTVNSDWELDDVFLGNRSCGPVPGGLVEGTITDANTGHALEDATITSASDPSGTASSGPLPSPGFYQLFASPAGTQSLTMTAPYYTAVTRSVDVTANKIIRENAALPAGRLSIAPAGLSATEPLGSRKSATGTITVANTGSAPAAVKLATAPGGFTLPGQPAARRAAAPPAPGAPLNLIKGHYSLLPGRAVPAGSRTAAAKTAAETAGAGSSWVTGADYPASVEGSAVATDPGTGWVYSAGGNIGGEAAATAYAYDPYTQAWHHLPRMPVARQNSVAAFTGGKLYVIGGWNSNGDSKPQMEIYDPAARSWSQGTSEPVALAASAVAVLDGDIYVIGGCSTSVCGSTAVQFYDPSTGIWNTAAAYPEQIAYQGCGTISGQIYCAGGSTGTVQGTTHAYVYDPVTNAWTGFPSLPIDLWGMAYSASGGQLLLSGGVTGGGRELTNQGFAYTPGAGWSALPNSPDAVYRAGSGCGMYVIGGYSVGTTSTASTQIMPGYDDCASGSSVPWLSVKPTATTVDPGKGVPSPSA